MKSATLPDAPARARAFAAVLAESPHEIREHVATAFRPGARIDFEGLGPKETVLDGGWAVRYARLIRGLDVLHVEATDAETVRLIVRELRPLASGRALIECAVEPDPPRRIVTWGHQSMDYAPDPRPDWASRTAALESVLDDLAADSLFSGVVLLRHHGRRAIFSRGFARLNPTRSNDPSTRLNIASITKLLTAVAVLRLAGRGLVALDAPVSAILTADLPQFLAPITIRQLLTHTSGLPEEAPADAEGTGAETPAHAGGWLAALDRVQLQWEPGTAFGYSNAGYAVLGSVIEAAFRRPYFVAITELVLKPAGLSSTAFADTASPGERTAIGYGYEGDDDPVPRRPNLDAGLGRGAPYGYATSTVEDLERLIDAIVARRILSGGQAEAILRGAIPMGDGGRRAGCGMFADQIGSTTVSTTNGAGPGISAWLDVAPEADYLAVVLANQPKPAAHRVGRFIRSVVFRAGTPSV